MVWGYSVRGPLVLVANQGKGDTKGRERTEGRGLPPNLSSPSLASSPLSLYFLFCPFPYPLCVHTHIHTQTSLSLPPAPFLVLHGLIPFLVLPGSAPPCHHDNHSPQADTSGARVHGVLQLYHPHADLLQDNQDA